MKFLKWINKNLHLLISLIVVIPTAIIYGSPSLLPAYLDIQVNTIDFSNLLKANMFFYFGVSTVWIAGICKSKYWKKATQLNVLFMLSLAFGRICSMMLDGWPSGGYIFGVVAELLIGTFSVLQLNAHSAKKSDAEY